MNATAPSAPDALPPATRGWRRLIGRLYRRHAVMAALAFLVFVTLVALLAPWLIPHDPHRADLARMLQGPSGAHWAGTDDLGRDMLSRLMMGARLSLSAAVQAVAIAMLIGVPPGLASGYLGGRTDAVIMRCTDAMLSFPGLILAISIIGFLGPGLTNAMIAIGVTFSPYFARIVRGATLAVREETYVEAAETIGTTDLRIVLRHVIPNIMSPIVVQATLTLGLAILAEASLSFLGLGVQPPDASWGAMLGRAFAYMHRAPLNVVTPGLLIMLTVLAFNILGDGLRDAVGRQTRSVD